jgi:Flp pilus assembly protein TadB
MSTVEREPLTRREPVTEAPARRGKGRSVLAFAVIFIAVLVFLAICNANGARVPLWGAPIVAAAVGLLGVLATSNA